MPEFAPGDPETMERVFLWDDITEVFQGQANTFGIQLSSEAVFTNIVLESEPYDAYDEETYTLQMWGQWVSGFGLVRASLIYIDTESGAQKYSYEVTAKHLNQCAINGAEPTPLDVNDLQEIRDDIKAVRWSPELSERCARDTTFFL